MRAVLIYWVIGCLFVGTAYGVRLNKCPNDPIDEIRLMATVATWPSVFAAAIVWDSSVKRNYSCKQI